MQKKSKVLIVIPAYNEEKSICRVAGKIRDEFSQYDYVVVNDGSKDNTVSVCKENGLNVLNLRVNLGLTAAFQAGVKLALANDYDYVIQIDGDGQHQPQYIGEMLNYAEEHKADIVIGARYLTKNKDYSMRMIGSRLITSLIRITTGEKICDPTSGMRMYNKKAMKALATKGNLRPEPDTISWLIKCGAKVMEYPVIMLERQEGESYLNFTKSIKYMWRMCFSILIVQQLRGREKL